MDLDFIDASGRDIGRRKAPMPPRRGEIVLLPPPFPKEVDVTASIEAARYHDPEPYRVEEVVWDLLRQRVQLIVEPTQLPTALG